MIMLKDLGERQSWSGYDSGRIWSWVRFAEGWGGVVGFHVSQELIEKSRLFFHGDFKGFDRSGANNW